ncbi:juvenile hormone acid O-methyltransferase-like isoform X2 [Pogonomyrmex barbatus]|uniref:Juvenile hormone acid O-methyltransferase-like isoform X2 n=1 Tax=Pogonomyrmex barbatus TaxID=144034 RepID=A0A6I9WRB9_9HYME|nr:juvenile hormone acid O-methyltransferase-like isoform X2 [Pogonomyrmex barbatus]
MNNDQRCAMEMPEEYAKTNLLSRRDGQDIIEEFSSELSKVQGADISQVMVNYARKNNSNERLSYIILDIEGKMPSEQIGQYDCVTSFYCLHWIYDLSRAFENIFKLLRPNGKALVTFFGFHGMFEAFIRLSQNPRYEFYLQDVHRYVPYFQREKSKNMRASLRKMLEDIGFEILHCSKREKSFQYNSQQNLKIQILPVNPF